MKKTVRLLLIVLIAALFLSWPFLQRAFLHLTGGARLNISRSTAISTAELTRHQVYDIETELRWEGSGGYPCYIVYFLYKDETGLEIRMRCPVDGETGEAFNLERIDGEP